MLVTSQANAVHQDEDYKFTMTLKSLSLPFGLALNRKRRTRKLDPATLRFGSGGELRMRDE